MVCSRKFPSGNFADVLFNLATIKLYSSAKQLGNFNYHSWLFLRSVLQYLSYKASIMVLICHTLHPNLIFLSCSYLITL